MKSVISSHRDLLRPIIAASLLLCAFTVSLFYGGYEDTHYAAVIACLSGIFLLAVLPPLIRFPVIIPHMPMAILCALLWGYVTLSLSWSSVPFTSMVTYMVFLSLPLCFFALLLCGQTEIWLRCLFPALLGAITIYALWAVIQYCFLTGRFGARAAYPLTDANNLAALINLGLLPVLALLVGRKARDLRYVFYAVLCAVLFAGLLATESRAALFCAGAAACIIVMTLFRKDRNFLISVAIIISGGAVLFFIMSYIGDNQFSARLLNFSAAEGDESAMARVATWRNAWPLLRDHFAGGLGLGTFYLYYPSVRLPGADTSTGFWLHNDPYQFAIEMGIAAPVLFYAFGAAALWQSIRFLRHNAPDDKNRIIGAGLLAALLALFAHSHITFHLYVMPILMIAGVWLAFLYHVTGSGRAYRQITLTRMQAAIAATAIIIITGLFFIMAASSAYAQYQMAQARQLLVSGKPVQFMHAIDITERWAPRSFIDPEVQLATFYINMIAPDKAGALFTTEQQDYLYEEAMTLLDNADQMNPAWAEIPYQRGKLYIGLGDSGNAVLSFTEAIRRNKMHFDARKALANLYIMQGQAAKAFDILDEGLRYPHSIKTQKDFVPVLQELKPLADIQHYYNRQSGAPHPPEEQE